MQKQGNRKWKNAFDTFCDIAKHFLQMQRCHWHQHFWNGSVVNMFHSYQKMIFGVVITTEVYRMEWPNNTYFMTF